MILSRREKKGEKGVLPTDYKPLMEKRGEVSGGFKRQKKKKKSSLTLIAIQRWKSGNRTITERRYQAKAFRPGKIVKGTE